KWSDFKPAYGVFYREFFVPVQSVTDPKFGGLPASIVEQLLERFVASYVHDGPQEQWFLQIRHHASALGFAATTQAYKANPAAYAGSIKEASRVIRVALTSEVDSPELFWLSRVIGADEVKERVAMVLAASKVQRAIPS